MCSIGDRSSRLNNTLKIVSNHDLSKVGLCLSEGVIFGYLFACINHWFNRMSVTKLFSVSRGIVTGKFEFEIGIHVR